MQYLMLLDSTGPDHVFTSQARAEKYAQRQHAPSGTGHPLTPRSVAEEDAIAAFVDAVTAVSQI